VGVVEAGVVRAVFEDSPWVSVCTVLKRFRISGSSKIRRLWSVFLFCNQLIISRPFCWVVKGSSGLSGVLSLLSDLSRID